MIFVYWCYIDPGNLRRETCLDYHVTYSHVSTFRCFAAGIANERERLYGVQFHPEVDLSENGVAILKNFLRGIAQFHGTFTMKSREEECIRYIRSIVGSHKVLVSIGVSRDSTDRIKDTF